MKFSALVFFKFCEVYVYTSSVIYFSRKVYEKGVVAVWASPITCCLTFEKVADTQSNYSGVSSESTGQLCDKERDEIASLPVMQIKTSRSFDDTFNSGAVEIALHVIFVLECIIPLLFW